MRKVKIITDSCADLTAKLLEKYDIDYCKMSTVYNGEESPALLTWTYEEAHALYDVMRDGNRITTAQVSVGEFRQVFGKYLLDGCDIIYIGCSSKQSGSVNTGRLVAKKLLEEYPEAQIFCIDSLRATIGEGILAIEAAKMAESGMKASEIAEKITAMRNNVHQFATVHTLDYLKRAGRVSATSAFLGNLMGVKPLLVADAEGVQTAFKKIKGRAAAVDECIRLLGENITDDENQTVYLWHADCDLEEVTEVYNKIKIAFPHSDIEVGLIGPIIGASAGPGVIGVFSVGKPVTFTAQA